MAKRMSKARKAIFAKFPWLTEVDCKNYHSQIEDDKILERLRKDRGLLPSLPFTGDKEHDGNLILEDALPHTSPEKRQEQGQGMVNRSIAYSQNCDKFYHFFKSFLKKYWQGNLLGFDVVRFDIEIVKPVDGESTIEAIRRKWGEEAVKVVEELVV